MQISDGLSSQWLAVSEPEPYILHVELSRPPVNAFSIEQVEPWLHVSLSTDTTRRFWRAYGALFDRIIQEGRDVRAVVVSSALSKVFSAGIDFKDGLKARDDASDAARTWLSTYHHLKQFQSAIGAPQRCPFPVIVAVHGLVAGLGMDLMYACDIRYAAESTQFTIKEVAVGHAADIGTLASKITSNHSLMHELAYTSRMFTSNEALQLGLVSRVCAGGQKEVTDAALKLAKAIVRNSPIAVSGTKHILTHARDQRVLQNLDYVAAWNASALQTKVGHRLSLLDTVDHYEQDIPESIRAMQTREAPVFQPLSKPKL
ncbi:Delta-2 dienoyl-CoA isomerase [Mycena indigotica]|uniref:Delta-2 dienoyl-CoA isomerase n=1 Tax=Mycena indigotica TaxID=2126181 RepID=A0A8H6VUL6_9AGAR|nr:Delta-2 dienoyl-CoA isomerase [Mycena indigotica]KAF7294527.1 Delta-2 dienoyl-CoA isomerase [Mycena indigotica]